MPELNGEAKDGWYRTLTYQTNEDWTKQVVECKFKPILTAKASIQYQRRKGNPVVILKYRTVGLVNRNAVGVLYFVSQKDTKQLSRHVIVSHTLKKCTFSSVGRAFDLDSKGHRFDPDIVLVKWYKKTESTSTVLGLKLPNATVFG